MLASLAAFWAGLPQWVRDAIKVAGIVLGLVLLGKAYGASKKNEGRKEAKSEIAIKQAEVRVRVQERSTEIINEERHNADEAIRARDTSPLYPTPDVMPDDLRRVTFGDKRGS